MLVRVGPVTTRSRWPERRITIVAREHLLRIKTALVHARECVWCHESARGTPSLPSLSPAIPHIPSRAFKASAKLNRSSVSRPPLPVGPGPIDTVVSPPESRTAGPPTGRPQDRDDSAIPPMTLPTLRASPSSASPRMSGFIPRLVGASPAAASARAGAATTRASAGGSKAFGVSSPYSSTRRAAAGCLSGADHDTSAFRRGRRCRGTINAGSRRQQRQRSGAMPSVLSDRPRS